MEDRSKSQEFHILMVEDNAGDVRLVQEAFKETGSVASLHVVEDGIKAMQFLTQEILYQNVPRPDLILLDLNLPKKDGREVLAEIKKHPDFGKIPVIVLTTSQAEKDIISCYALCANCYMTKPVDLDEFFSNMRAIEKFWFHVARLPS